jgi:hypothetical protein
LKKVTAVSLTLGLAIASVAGFSAFSLIGRKNERNQRLSISLKETRAEVIGLQSALASVEGALSETKKAYEEALIRAGVSDLPDLTRVRLSNEEKKVSDELLASGVNGVDRAKALNAWIFSSIAPTDGIDPSRILTEMMGQCADRDVIFSNVMEGLGTPSRRVSFFNVPVQLGHTATEFFIENRWRFFDSTAGLFFTKKGSAEPIGIAEARSLYPDIDVWQADRDYWTGAWQRLESVAYRKLTSNYIVKKGAPSEVAIDVERTYFASNMAGAPEEPVFFSTIALNSRTKPKVVLGDKDGSASDLVEADGPLYAPLLERIGRYDHLLTGTRFVFRTGEVRTAKVVVTYLSDSSAILADLDHSSRAFSFDETAIGSSIEGRTVEYVF